MKKVSSTIILELCFSLLAACSSNNQKPETSDEITPSMNQNDVPTVLPSPDTKPEDDSEQAFLMPEYDYSANKLVLFELSGNTPFSSYSFETAQTPMLTEKVNGGVVMLSSQAANIQNTNGVSISTEDNSEETLFYWHFDDEMNLLKKYELTDSELIKGLKAYIFTVSPNGGEIMYAVGDRLYGYTFESQKLEEVIQKTSDEVYYEMIHYSASSNYLEFLGSISDRDGTAYGSINLNDGTSKVFFVDNFSAGTLFVNGEYAEIADSVRPASMGGSAGTNRVLYLDLVQQQGKEIGVESDAESDLASVSNDGRYVITCNGGDGPSGVLRVYKAADGVKAIDQPYTMNVNCKPYQILVREQSAYAVLGTDSGKLLSSAVILP